MIATLKNTTIRRSHEARRDESRAKILAAAERLFARDGLAGARTETIAAAAGVNKALLYYYFKSKDRLYEAVIEQHLSEFNRQALGILNASGLAHVLLLRYVGLHFDFLAERHRHAALFQQLIMKNGKPPERLFRQYIAPRSEALQKLLRRGMAEGGLRPTDPFHTAVSLAGLIVFYFSAAPMLQLTGYPDLYAKKNLQRRRQEVLDLVRHGLLADPHSLIP
jgi:TetR/AcrR family transcriptional regulator